MSLKDWFQKIVLLLPLTALSASAAVAADGACAGGSCSTAPACGTPACAKICCPGPYVHCTPKVPCLKYKCACGKPLCDLCDMPGYGYHPTCWRAWDQPLNYQCCVPTPTQLVHPPAEMFMPSDELLPAPTTETGDPKPKR